MITSNAIRRCAYIDTIQLEKLIQKNHPKHKVMTSSFLGVTNGGQFCYSVMRNDQEEIKPDKVFVWLNHEDKILADY